MTVASFAIAAGRRVIGHQQNRLPGRRHLDGAGGHRLRKDLAARHVLIRRAFEPVAHAIGARRDAKPPRSGRAASRTAAVLPGIMRSRAPPCGIGGACRRADGNCPCRPRLSAGHQSEARSPAFSERPPIHPCRLTRCVDAAAEDWGTSKPPATARYARAPLTRAPNFRTDARRHGERRVALRPAHHRREIEHPRQRRRTRVSPSNRISGPSSVTSSVAAVGSFQQALASRCEYESIGAADRHTARLKSPAAQVLHGRQHPRPRESITAAMASRGATNFTRSPALRETVRLARRSKHLRRASGR